MLVPLDGSELAEVVFPYARELAGRLDLDLVFLNVCNHHESESLPMRRVYIEHAAEVCQLRSREVQEKTGVEAKIKPIEARGEVALGYPAEEILRYAENNQVDFILMATHGHSGVKRWIMGSTANKVLRASKIPIWLVRASIPEEIVYDKWPKRTMLVPLDGSNLAESVLPHVEALAKQRGAELVDVVLLRICESPYISADYPFPDWEEHVKQITAYWKQVSEQYLIGVEKRLKDAGLKVKSEVLMGNPTHEIIDYASKNPFNLIVMATHGHSGANQWAYGSVTDRVLQGVSSPIFLVRPR